MKRGILIDPHDNVGIVVDPVQVGEQIKIDEMTLTALDTINLPHKIALFDLYVGDIIRKYGETIGYATCEIRVGHHVHVHNMDSEKLMK